MALVSAVTNGPKTGFNRGLFFSNLLSGLIQDEYLRECLMTMGERWTDDMVDDLFHGAPIQNGLFDYMEFTRTLKHGSRDKEDDQVPSLPLEELAFNPNAPK